MFHCFIEGTRGRKSGYDVDSTDIRHAKLEQLCSPPLTRVKHYPQS